MTGDAKRMGWTVPPACAHASLAVRLGAEPTFKSCSAASRSADCAITGNAVLIVAIAIRNHAQLAQNKGSR